MIKNVSKVTPQGLNFIIPLIRIVASQLNEELSQLLSDQVLPTYTSFVIRVQKIIREATPLDFLH